MLLYANMLAVSSINRIVRVDLKFPDTPAVSEEGKAFIRRVRSQPDPVRGPRYIPTMACAV